MASKKAEINFFQLRRKTVKRGCLQTVVTDICDKNRVTPIVNDCLENAYLGISSKVLMNHSKTRIKTVEDIDIAKKQKCLQLDYILKPSRLWVCAVDLFSATLAFNLSMDIFRFFWRRFYSLENASRETSNKCWLHTYTVFDLIVN